MTTSYVTDRDGHAVSFDQIYNTYFSDIFNYVLRRVGDVNEAEDLTSQTFLKALRGLGRFRWQGVPLSAWLYRIATNEVNGYFRRGKVRRTEPLAAPEEANAALESERRDAEAELLRHETFSTLSRCVRDLKPMDQSLIALRFFEHKPFAEIAQILGKRRSAVITRTHRALAKLKELLERRGVDYERFREDIDGREQAKYSGRPIQASASS